MTSISYKYLQSNVFLIVVVVMLVTTTSIIGVAYAFEVVGDLVVEKNITLGGILESPHRFFTIGNSDGGYILFRDNGYVSLESDDGGIRIDSGGGEMYFDTDKNEMYFDTDGGDITLDANGGRILLATDDNVLQFNTNGEDFEFLNGNVGIGTTAPHNLLTVAGMIESTFGGFKFPDGTTQTTSSIGGGSSLWTQSGSNVYYNSGNVGIGTSSPTAALDITGNMHVTGNSIINGNVGIGVSAPTQPLQVAGIIESTSGGFKFPDGTIQTTSTTSGNGNITSVIAGIGLLGGGTTGSVTLEVDTLSIQSRVTGSCDLGSSISTINSNGTVTCETDDVVDNLWTQSDNDINYIDGNVGIGTTLPSHLLSVTGIIESTYGGFKFPDGTIQDIAGITIESDPVFGFSAASSISQIDIDNWDDDQVDDADNDPTNEIETWSTLSGIPADIADGDDIGTGDITGVTAGTGLLGGGTTGDVKLDVDSSLIQSRVTGSCNVGSSISAINLDGTVSCETDDVDSSEYTLVKCTGSQQGQCNTTCPSGWTLIADLDISSYTYWSGIGLCTR